MKKKVSTKRFVIVVVIVMVITVLFVWGYQSTKDKMPESPDAVSLSQGRQARFENLYIGLSSVNDDSAWLSFHQDGEEGSTTKQVTAGETIEIYGYKIEIKSIYDSWVPSIMPGSSSDNIKFIIKKY